VQTICLSKPAWPAAGRRLALLGLLTLFLLPAPARSQSAWPSQDLRKTPVGVMAPGRPSSSCPLPPVSAFTLQTNLRKYLEAWPTPGSTFTDDWPEYFPEDGEDLG
jgi:hypothetical protein